MDQAAKIPRAGPAAGARLVYYISDRPEAYEIWGEVSHDEAAKIGQTIAAHAARHFPQVEFRVDGAWHVHQSGIEHVAAYVDGHLQAWVAEALGR